LIASFAALALTRVVAVPSNAYDPLAEPIKMLTTKGPDQWLLACFFTFGPVAIAAVVAHARGCWQLLRQRLDMCVWLAGCGVLAFVGGSDTERILGWCAPVMYVLIGRALEQYWPRLRGRRAAIAVLAAVQLLSARVFWPVPVGYYDPQPLPPRISLDTLYQLADRVLVMQHNYANLWSYFGSRPLHLLNLIVDLLFAAALVAWLRRGATDSSSASIARRA
jgi:hypothetical protein